MDEKYAEETGTAMVMQQPCNIDFKEQDLMTADQAQYSSKRSIDKDKGDDARPDTTGGNMLSREREVESGGDDGDNDGDGGLWAWATVVSA